LVPICPFFVINPAMGLTHLRTVRYYVVTQLGILAGTNVYVYAGNLLSKIDSLNGILSPGLLLSLALLGIFPLTKKNDLEFEVLNNTGNTVARSFGLVFQTSDAFQEVYRKFSLILPDINGDGS